MMGTCFAKAVLRVFIYVLICFMHGLGKEDQSHAVNREATQLSERLGARSQSSGTRTH